MDARERLRLYLEQRKELGERELVLDGLTVEEMMRLIGAQSASGTPGPSRHGDDREGAADDWRTALRAAGSAPPTERNSGERPAHPEVVARGQASPVRGVDAPAGLIVGSASREHFDGPFNGVPSLEALATEIARCTRCTLHQAATNPVPGEGSPTAGLVCVGEAPGANEDASGRPFVGPAGQLLTKILAAIDLTREQVFICNVLKHRPPANRNPAPDEVEACRPYLVRQLELIRPKVIVAFGTFAAQTLLATKLSIGNLRGQIHRYHGTPLIVTYHPAALLRNPAWKRPTWEDVQLARRILDSANDA